MNDLPAPTAEGKLIRQARELAIPKLSIRAAAARIGMSPEQWGNIERGYRYTKQDDPHHPLSAPATTIAKMANAVGVTSEQLTGAGRDDAARALEEIRRPLRTTEDMRRAIESHMAEVQVRVAQAASAHPGRPLTGDMVFGEMMLGSVRLPASPKDAANWDGLVRAGESEAGVIQGVAAIAAWRQEKAARAALGEDDRDGSAAGLDRGAMRRLPAQSHAK